MNLSLGLMGVLAMVLLSLLGYALFSAKRAGKDKQRIKELETENAVLEELQEVDVPDTHDERISSMSKWNKK
jgi:hypothetical protein